MMRLRGPGFQVDVPRDATRQQLLQRVRRVRPARQLLFSDEPMPRGARLWQDLGMRDDAAFQIQAQCDHARLGVEDDGCLRCTDCGAYAPIAFRTLGPEAGKFNGVTMIERTPETDRLVNAWKNAPAAGCRHPVYTTELRRNAARYKDVRYVATCSKCGGSADAVRALERRLMDRYEASHAQ